MSTTGNFHRRSFYLICVVGSVFCLNIGAFPNRAQAQSGSSDNSEKVDNKIPAELLARPEIAAEVQRLRSLRKSAALFGRKHPAYSATQKQIAELESKLSTYIPSESGPAQTESVGPTSAKAVPMDNPGKQALQKEQMEMQLDFSRIDFGRDTRLELAYPKLELPALRSIGVFPGLGLMWGIEVDPEFKKSLIWQWHDLPDETNKSLYFESDGVIEAIAFPSDLAQYPHLFMVIRRHDRGDIDRITVLQMAIAPLPPFTIARGTNPTVILQAKTLSHDRIFATYTDTNGLLLVCHGDIHDSRTDSAWNLEGLPRLNSWLLYKATENLSALDSSASPYPSTKASTHQPNVNQFAIRATQADGVLDVLYSGNALPHPDQSRLVADPKSGEIFLSTGASVLSNENRSPITKTSRGIQSVFYDTTREPVLIDDFGQLLVIRPRAGQFESNDLIASDETFSSLPQRISQTKWFEDIQRRRLSSSFLMYKPIGLSKKLPPNVQVEFHMYIPKDKAVSLNNDKWEFPPGAVLLQIFNQSTKVAEPRYLSTFGLVRTELEWIPFVYDWNFEQNDAILQTKQVDEMKLESSQEEQEFLEARRNVSILSQNCISCHQGPNAFGGLGISQSMTILVDSSDNQSVRLEDYLTRNGYIRK